MRIFFQVVEVLVFEKLNNRKEPLPFQGISKTLLNINNSLFNIDYFKIMADAFKEQLESFLMKIITKIKDSSQIEELQKSYEELIDECI